MFSRQKWGTASGDTTFRTITGYSISETGNALAATVTFRNASAGTILWTVNIPPGETRTMQFGENPVISEFDAPFYLSLDAGTVQYAVFGK